MKGLLPLILGIFATFAFSWTALVLIPNAQIGHLDPQTDEDGNDPYPAPQSGMAERGGRIYAANGCVYCHSQQVRADYAASDIDRKWGERRSAPRDYLFERPVMLGRSRLGPDLANIGQRAPAEEADATAAAAPAAAPTPGAIAAPATPAAASAPAAPVAASAAPPASSPAPVAPTPTAAVAAKVPDGQPARYSSEWHHLHLFDPRRFAEDSNMPAYRFLYEQRRIGGQPSVDALKLTGTTAPPEGWEIVPSYDAKCLVAYLMSLNQSHPLNELKSTAAAAPAAPGKAAK